MRRPTDFRIRFRLAGPRAVSGLAAVILALAAVSIAPGRARAAEPAATGVDSALDAIDRAGIVDHLKFLTSDELEGRNTPTRGLDRAADYIAGKLEAFGLRPVGDKAPYFHGWNTAALVVSPISALSLHVPGNQDVERSFKLFEDFVPVYGSAETEVRGRVVFAGYGITAREERYDDYQGKSVHDKIVIALSHEPRQTMKGKRFDGPEPTKHSRMLEKARNAAERGAKALLIVTNPLYHERTETIGFEFPHMPSPRSPMRPRNPSPIPVAHISLEVAEEILGQKIEPLQKKIDRSMRNKLISGPTHEVQLRVRFEEETVTTQNVIAMHEGSDPAVKDEIVIVGAHYDHIGVSPGGVNNGADDNASGTTALLELAQAFGESEIATRRSIVFLFFSGEEKGLVGSKRYAEKPLFPLDKTVAMLNMDMVGRNESRRIDVLGGSESPRLLAAAKKAAAKSSVGLKLQKGSQEFFKRSDHYSFYEKGVPALFFFSGLHEDYHQPSDEMNKIDVKKIERVARMVFLTALELAEES